MTLAICANILVNVQPNHNGKSRHSINGLSKRLISINSLQLLDAVLMLISPPTHTFCLTFL